MRTVIIPFSLEAQLRKSKIEFITFPFSVHVQLPSEVREKIGEGQNAKEGGSEFKNYH
jgi:hypothetical protein